MHKALAGRPDRNEINASAVDAIMRGFQSDAVMGHQLNYMWFLQHQDTAGFDGIVVRRAADSAEHGQIWSKMGAAEAISTATVGAAVALESSVQGYIFNGLGFGLPRWDDSPTMGELWLQLSRTYAQGLTNRVTAHVLDGIHDSSVLTTTEWPEAKKRIESGEIGGLDILVYTASPGEKRNELILTTTYTVRTQEDFDNLPKVPDTDEWRAKQREIDAEQKQALTEIYDRAREIIRLGSDVENILSEQGGEDRTPFRPMRTPNNSVTDLTAGDDSVTQQHGVPVAAGEGVEPDTASPPAPQEGAEQPPVSLADTIFEALNPLLLNTDETVPAAPEATGTTQATPEIAPEATEIAPDTPETVPEATEIAPDTPETVPEATEIAPDTPELAEQRAVHAQLINNPGEFLKANKLSMDTAVGMNARWDRPALKGVHAELAKALDTLDRHWFVLTLDPRRDGPGSPAYVLTPALEKYVSYAKQQKEPPFLAELVGHADLPPVLAEDNYLHSSYVPYLRGGASDPDTKVGHVKVPLVPGDAPGAGLVFTATMNGCAFAVTRSPGAPDSFRAWHYQSPGRRMEDALAFQHTHRTMDWFGDNEYMSSGGGKTLPEVTNILSFGSEGWEIFGQEVLTSAHNMKETHISKTSTRLLKLEPADDGERFRQAGAVYSALAEEHLRNISRASAGLTKNNAPKNLQDAAINAQRKVAAGAGSILIAGNAGELHSSVGPVLLAAKVALVSLRNDFSPHAASKEAWANNMNRFLGSFESYLQWLSALRTAAERLRQPPGGDPSAPVV
ncbi:hypothetical protein QFZ71_001801 [Streptomyces sp. V2I9]|nr:hypothetical protein [Streptomyces sp. V2I9]